MHQINKTHGAALTNDSLHKKEEQTFKSCKADYDFVDKGWLTFEESIG